MILSSPGSVGAGAGFDISEPMKDDLPFFGRLILKSTSSIDAWHAVLHPLSVVDASVVVHLVPFHAIDDVVIREG
jgi:hypothetical protein